jgi:membrane fusion protein (multidrug efflux system)
VMKHIYVAKALGRGLEAAPQQIDARRHLRIGLIAAAVLCTVVFGGCGDKNAHDVSPQPAEVGVETVQAHRIVESTELAGRLSAVRIAEVRPQVEGIVRQRLFTEGSQVKAGDVLYQIDPATYQATYDQDVGTLAKAQATAAAAQSKATRYAELVKIDGVSKQDYDDAVASLKEDQADVIADLASLKSASISLGYTKVRAPISGRIGKSTVTEGALVTSEQTTALSTIQSCGEMYLDVTRSSVDWLRLQTEFASGLLQKAGDGAVVHLVMEDGSEYALAGKLLFSDITVDSTTGSVTLRSMFPNPNGVLLPGMYVRAHLEEGVLDQAITVPQIAVTRAADGSASVLTVSGDNKVVQTPVTADTAYTDRWVVTKGLKSGDKVIVSGTQKARTGSVVKPVEVSTNSATAATSAEQPRS